jgi:hypothetical protein
MFWTAKTVIAALLSTNGPNDVTPRNANAQLDLAPDTSFAA